MIIGAHAIIYTQHADEARAFLGDALGLRSVDAGDGWLIFALPPAELAVHPGEEPRHELYLLCDDIARTIAELEAKGASFGPVSEQSWGRLVTMTIPGGTELQIYEPSHPRPTADG
ncbi:MAG: VOC family protein [Chloroflexota bacterium]